MVAMMLVFSEQLTDSLLDTEKAQQANAQLQHRDGLNSVGTNQNISLGHLSSELGFEG